MIWRRIDMPLSTTLEALHEAIQMTMGWTFSHLWEFDIDGRCYGDPSFREFDDEPPVYKAKGLQLGTVIARGVGWFVYTYDYGDNWRHDVIVEEVRDGDPDMEYPAFVDGARRCPPEDVGGPDGFMDFLEAVLDSAHEQHRDMVRWYGGPFDPIGLDEKQARFGMENMARRRRGPLASHRTGITATETLTAVVSNGRGIDGGVFGVGPSSLSRAARSPPPRRQRRCASRTSRRPGASARTRRGPVPHRRCE